MPVGTPGGQGVVQASAQCKFLQRSDRMHNCSQPLPIYALVRVLLECIMARDTKIAQKVVNQICEREYLGHAKYRHLCGVYCASELQESLFQNCFVSRSTPKQGGLNTRIAPWPKYSCKSNTSTKKKENCSSVLHCDHKSRS